MQPYAFLRWVEPAVGVLLMVLALLDLFLTVLYARAGAGFISDRVARSTWAVFCWSSKRFGRHRDLVLSLCGSTVVVALVAAWASVLTLGAAFIMHPYLGTTVRSTDGSTGTDFLTALYVGGISMSVVGASDYSARTTVFRMIFLFNSVVGMSVMTLALTYIMQVYRALQNRNAFGLSVHMMSRKTGDAAVLVEGLAPNDNFTQAYSSLGQMANAISADREAHDFYPVLFYFRFPEARYSVSRTTLLALDTVSLIRAAIPDGKNGWIKESASVSQLWEVSLLLLRTLQNTFLPDKAADAPVDPGPQERERWRRRYLKALTAFRNAGIETISCDEDGADAYVGMRCHWNHYVTNLASYMAWQMEEIDTATPPAT